MSISTAVDASAVARVVGIKTAFKNLRQGIVQLPMRIAVLGQGRDDVTYATTKRQVFSAQEAGEVYGFGSPIHLAVKELLPTNGDQGVGSIPVTVYPLVDGTTKAVGSITPSGTPTAAEEYYVKINNIVSARFVVAVGATVAQRVAAMVTAINANLDMPVIAADNASTDVTLTAKWAGVTGNDIYAEVVGSTTAGNVWTIVQPTGGAGNPTVDAALAQIGNVWETLLLNCLGPEDTAALDAIKTFGDGRWGALVRKPFMSFVGENVVSVATAITVPDGRKTDKINVQLPAPGSRNLQFVIAAAELAKIAVQANNKPASDYGSQSVPSLVPGSDADQWTYTMRDTAVKAGCSTIEVRDGVVTISDVVTFYHPTGDGTPAYRYVVDVIKIMNILFNIDLAFVTPEWDGAPLIPNDQPTINPDARKPKDVVATMCAIIDSLASNAFISDPDYAKKNTFAEINSSNPKRCDCATTMKISGNNNIMSFDFNFGFHFGVTAAAA